MEGCATPDNHSLMIHQITDTFKRYGGMSYDLRDHEEIVADPVELPAVNAQARGVAWKYAIDDGSIGRPSCLTEGDQNEDAQACDGFPGHVWE